jgi:hypothetical protein
MKQQITGLTGTALLMIGLLNSTAAEAFFGNMMNPSRWFGGDRDYDDYYGDYYGGPGYGPGYYPPPMGYGAPGYAPPGYGAPAHGYAPPAYSAPVPAPVPAKTDTATSDEIRQLKQRIEQLEQERAASAAPGQAGTYDSHTGSSPAAVASPRTVYGAPAGGQTTPAPSRSMGGHAGAADRQASPVQGAVQPGVQQSPTSVDWRPSGYYHPAMQ